MRTGRAIRALWAGSAACLALAAGGVGPADGQAVQVLDRGTFELRVDGTSVGTETFAIRRERSSVRAVGRVQVGGRAGGWRSGRVWLQTDPGFRPQLFRMEPSDGDAEMAAAVRQDSRLRVQTTTSAGQRSKEFVAPPELSVLSLDVAHQLYFLLRQHAASLSSGGQTTVPAVLPVQRRRVTVRIRRGPTEEITVPGGPRQAIRHVIEADGERVDAWTDDQGRILRVHYPEDGRTAVRTREEGS